MNDRLGNAKWEDQAEVSRRYRYTEGNFWLGRAEDSSPIGYNDDRHICLVSGTRGGKGTSIIVNNLCYWPGSAVVIDPKGENATVTAARRGRGSAHCDGMGQAVHVLDPFEAAQGVDGYRSAFNPLDALDPTREESIDEAARLANALIVVKDDRADPFFDESARSMVQALILHVVTAPDFETAERTLLMVRQLLKRGEWRIADVMREQASAEGSTPDDTPPHQLLWRSLEINPAFSGVVAGDGSRFLGMMMNSPKTFESVLQAAIVNTDFLDSPGMRRVLAESSFRLSELKTRPEGMTLYLSLPQRYMDTHYRWLRMMVALTTTEMEIARGRPATGHPVLMVLDEFAGLKRMTAIENAVSQIAGFGVKLFFVLQSLEQLKYIYKDNWETFLSNAGLKIFFSVEDHFTRDYVSKLIGETEIVRELHSTNEGRSDTESFAEGRTQSETCSQSTTKGTSESHTVGTSQTATKGRSKTVNQSQTAGTNWSDSETVSRGTNQSQSQSVGNSQGVSYKKTPFFFFWEVVQKDSITYSNGVNSSSSATTGTSSGVSKGTSRGGSSGNSRGVSEGISDSEATGRSESRTRGTSYSETSGTSETTGTSETRTRGNSTTRGQGRAESLHKRLLLPPDEMGRLFVRIDDPKHPAYPGFALVLLPGRDPVVVHRRHYFEDVQFIDCFSPHPDHTFLPPAEEAVQGIGPWIDKLEEAKGGKLTVARWFVHKGKVFKAGNAAARIEQVPPDNRTVHLQLPVTGKVSYVGAPADELAQPGHYRVPRGVLYKLKHYDGSGQRIDPFAELRAACAALVKPAVEPPPLPLSPPRQPRSRRWMPRLGAGCILLSAVTYLLQVWAFLHYPLLSRDPVQEALESAFAYFGVVWGGMILGEILLWCGRKQLHHRGWPFAALIGGSVVGEALGLAKMIGWLASINPQASLLDNLQRAQIFLHLVLWQPIVLGLYGLWLWRAVSRSRSVVSV